MPRNCDPALGQPRKPPDGTTELISTRPGRIDKAVELTYMEADDKKRILSEYPEELGKMLAVVERYPTLQESPAQFQERCGQIALACFWREKHPQIEEVLHAGPTRNGTAERVLAK